MVRTRLTILIILLVLSQLLASGFLLWTIDNARYFIDRRRLSYHEVEGYFDLAEDARQLRQQLMDVAAGRTADAPAALEGSTDRLEADFDRLAAINRAEVHMVDRRNHGTVLPDVARTSALETLVHRLAADGRALAAGLETGWSADQVTAQVQAMLPVIRDDLRGLISTALTQENAESVGADASASRALSQLIVIALGVTGLGIVLGAVAIYFLTRRVRQPMGRLLAGVREFTQGRLEHRTALTGRDEFAQLGQALDDMASRLDRQREELLTARNTLADTVAERTAELARANAELRQTDDLRREFLANVSHELRTPITVIRGEADVTLRTAQEPEEYRDTLHRVVAQAGHLTKLVDDLLLIARSGAGALTLNRQPVALLPLLEEARSHATSLAGDDAEIMLSGDDLAADADRDRLTQLVMILLDNALRYTGPRARVHIETRRTGDEAEIRISDNGPGIGPRDIPHVFERFYRGGGPSRQDGSGLGLNIAKAIVDAHGGRIGIESPPGGGTLVTVALPLASGIRESA
jgi:signal transduction histidine kinase